VSLPAGLRGLYRRRSGDLVVTRRVELPRVTGARVVVATDLHARDDWFPESAVHRLVSAIEAVEDADLVLLGGDFVQPCRGGAERRSVDRRRRLLLGWRPAGRAGARAGTR
jgi:hypothetical protein